MYMLWSIHQLSYGIDTKPSPRFGFRGFDLYTHTMPSPTYRPNEDQKHHLAGPFVWWQLLWLQSLYYTLTEFAFIFQKLRGGSNPKIFHLGIVQSVSLPFEKLKPTSWSLATQPRSNCFLARTQRGPDWPICSLAPPAFQYIMCTYY